MSRAGVLLDRDGVINKRPRPGEYIRSWDEFEFIPEAVDWIRLFNLLDFPVIVITNQRGVSLGLMSREDLEAIHARMIDELAKRGARVDRVYYCPHAEDACNCRKPKPGLVLTACEEWDLEVSRSILIGDSETDEQLAEHCGMPFVRVCEGRILSVNGGDKSGSGPSKK